MAKWATNLFLLLQGSLIKNYHVEYPDGVYYFSCAKSFKTFSFKVQPFCYYILFLPLLHFLHWNPFLKFLLIFDNQWFGQPVWASSLFSHPWFGWYTQNIIFLFYLLLPLSNFFLIHSFFQNRNNLYWNYPWF